MKLGNVEVRAEVPAPGGQAVRLHVSFGAFIRHALDVTPEQARQMAAELLTAARYAQEGKGG